MNKKKNYLDITRIDYWDKLTDDEKTWLKQFLVDEYRVYYKDIKPKRGDKTTHKNDYKRRTDYYYKHRRKVVKDLEKTVNFNRSREPLDNLLADICTENSIILMQISHKIGRYNMSKVLDGVKEIITNNKTNDINIIKVEAVNYLEGLLKCK